MGHTVEEVNQTVNKFILYKWTTPRVSGRSQITTHTHKGLGVHGFPTWCSKSATINLHNEHIWFCHGIAWSSELQDLAASPKNPQRTSTILFAINFLNIFSKRFWSSLQLLTDTLVCVKMLADSHSETGHRQMQKNVVEMIVTLKSKNYHPLL